MQVVLFLLDTVFFVLVAAALVRGWMNSRRLGMNQQPALFCIAVTNWLVGPLRRTFLPKAMAYANTDWASYMAALLLSLLYSTLFHIVLGGQLPGVSALDWVFTLPFVAIVFLVRTMLQAMMVLVLVYAVLSWLQPQSPVGATLGQLVEPVLRPIRRFMPTIGGVDLSVLILVILIQIGLMVLR
jgi:YggT family protein